MSRKYIDLTSLIIIVMIILLLGRFLESPIAFYISVGSSMYPTLETGDLLLVVKSEYKPGDLVIWCSDILSCVCHRVVSVNSTKVVTKGDNNPLPDPPIPKYMIKYKVLFIIKSYIWIPLMIILLFIDIIRRLSSRSDFK